MRFHRTTVSVIACVVGVAAFWSCAEREQPASRETRQHVPNELVVHSWRQEPIGAAAFRDVGSGAQKLISVTAARTVSLDGDIVEGTWRGAQGPSTRTSAITVAGEPRHLDGDFSLGNGPGVRRAGSGVEERVLPTSGGYRRLWSFDQKPDQPGEITVAMEAAGGRLLDIDDAGVHMVSDGDVFRIDHGTWIDAQGARSPVFASYVGGKVYYRVPADLVKRSAFPAVLDPDVGAEWAVPPTPSEYPWWFAGDDDVSPVGFVPVPLPSGKLATIAWMRPYWSDPYTEGSDTIRITDLSAVPPVVTALAYRNLDLPGPSAVVGATCGSSDCIAFSWLQSGTVFLRRMSLDTFAWIDANAVPVSDTLNDAPVANKEPKLGYDGTHFLVCWADTASGSGVGVTCSSRNAGTLAAVAPSTAFGIDANGEGPSAMANVGAAFAILHSATYGAPQLSTLNGATGAVTGGPVTLPEHSTVVAEGSGFLAVSSSYSGLNARRFSTTAAPAGSQFVVFAYDASQQQPVAVPVGVRGTMVTVRDLSTPPYGLMGLEIPLGGTTGTQHDEFENLIPVSGAGNGALVAQGLYDSASILRYLKYDSTTSKYVPSANLPSWTYFTRRNELGTAFDAATSTYFLGWFDIGSEDAEAAGSSMPANAAIYVNAYQPMAGAAKNASPVAVRPGGTLVFAPVASYDSWDPSGRLDLRPLWAMDGALGTALVSYIAKKPNGDSVLVGQRVKSDGSLQDTTAVGLGTVTGVTDLVTSHSLTKYYVSYTAQSTGWRTVEIDPTATVMTPVAKPEGTPVPFGNAVGSAIPVFIDDGNTHTAPSVGIANASTLDVIKDLTADSVNWNPPAQPYCGGGGCVSFPVLYAGRDHFVAVYSPDHLFSVYCARVTPDGTVLAPQLCRPPAPFSTAEGVYIYAGAGTRQTFGSAAGKMLGVNGATNPPLLERWLVESTGTEQLPHLPFPMPTHPLAEPTLGLDAGSGTGGTSDYVSLKPGLVVQGGSTTALVAYFGEWTSPNGTVERDLYARWVRPGFPGGTTCTVNEECDSLLCQNSVCTNALLPEAGVDGEAGLDADPDVAAEAGVDGSTGGAGGTGGTGGTAGSGGVGGAAGTAGTGGDGGSGGSSGTGGSGGSTGGSGGSTGGSGGSTGGSGGSTGGSGGTTAGGSGGTAGKAGGAPAPEDGGGCGCTIPGSNKPTRGILLGGLVGALAVASRRRNHQ